MTDKPIAKPSLKSKGKPIDKGEDNPNRMYLYFIFEDVGDGWYDCYAMLDNGCLVAEHYLRDLSEIFNALWENHTLRQEAFNRMGVEVVPVYDAINVESMPETHAWLWNKFQHYGDFDFANELYDTFALLSH